MKINENMKASDSCKIQVIKIEDSLNPESSSQMR